MPSAPAHLHRLPRHPVDQLARIIRLPRDAAHVLRGVRAPHALLGGLRSLLGVLQLGVLARIPHLGQPLGHELDGDVIGLELMQPQIPMFL